MTLLDFLFEPKVAVAEKEGLIYIEIEEQSESMSSFWWLPVVQEKLSNRQKPICVVR